MTTGTAEHGRLRQCVEQGLPWKHWGPYLSERQWGTVREDYSESGDAWNYFSHDQARFRAYRWGEDGLAGICDDKQELCFALALWNGKDPILKERLFGLTNSEGNHGEDVKEYYYYLDSTPTHSYMRYLYKYTARPYPYDNLVAANRQRGRHDMEYELIDTDAFADDMYFDVFVEYAKESFDDILIKITIFNRGSEAATLHLMPTLWFRNRWSWDQDVTRPALQLVQGAGDFRVVEAKGYDSQTGFLYCEGAPPILFTENETNTQRLDGTPNASAFVKDGINDFVIHGRKDAVNPDGRGTKSCPYYEVRVPAGDAGVAVRLRLCATAPGELKSAYGPPASPFGDHFEKILAARQREADEFYGSIIPASVGEDGARVMRQAFAGMLWGKQFYYFDVKRWLSEHRHGDPRRLAPRNNHWSHLYNADVISMPDKWEYPWYAAWDLAFHTLALALVDEDFGKRQLELVLRSTYLDPNGQIPAYEWNFGDVNPPVHPWAAMFTYKMEKGRRGTGDIAWLKGIFHKLMLNFTWWVNRKDRSDKNLFEGGFLGLDNIGVFDRSAPLPGGGHLEQADGTAWMALFCMNMFEMAVEIAEHDPTYNDLTVKFAEHFLWIGSAMLSSGEEGMWDEADGFFYDVLRTPDGRSERLKVRSMVGLLPLCAAAAFEFDHAERYPEFAEHFRNFTELHPELVAEIHDPRKPGHRNRRLASVLDERRLRRVLETMLDENEFFSPYGIRSLSLYHRDHPYILHAEGQTYGVGYLPAESDSGMFGGNSNWRGPIWMPVNALIVRALLHYYAYYGESFTIECPTGSGRRMNLYQVAEELARRLASIFLRDAQGRRPVYGGVEKFQNDPHWRDLILFYEYFHGDNGAGIGASHQTGWTGVIATLMYLFATLSPDAVGEKGMSAAVVRSDP